MDRLRAPSRDDANAPTRIVHLSDVHLGPMPHVPLRLLNTKRAAGLLNWARKRRHIHLPTVANMLAADAVRQQADHIVVSGDLINIGLPSEVERARDWLRCLGLPQDVSVVPGNHDIYSTINGRRLGTEGLAMWNEHFQSSRNAPKYAQDAAFPFVRIIGAAPCQVALIGLNSAVETPPLIATGVLGATQLKRLADILQETQADGLIRMIVVHHPPLPGLADARHELADAAALADVLAHHGADLVIHGHNHRRMLNWAHGRSGLIPCVGVPSASTVSQHGHEESARNHIFAFSRASTDAPVEISFTARGLSPAGAIVDLEHTALAPPRVAAA